MNTSNPQTVDVKKIREMIELNPDARRYFYTRIDESWFGWLWKNGFLDVVKEKPKDPTRLAYRTPELDYVVRIAEVIPKEVVDFVVSFDVASTSNLETLDRFLWLATKLPAEQLARIVSKIRDEQWIQTLGVYHQWTFGYKDMLQKLIDAGDYESMLTLAEGILAVSPKEKADRTSFGSVGNPFYLKDIHYSEVFERLSEVGDDSLNRALTVALKTFNEVLSLSDTDDEVFAIRESMALYDVDFFDLEIGEGKNYSYREDVRDLAALTKILITRTIEALGEDAEAVRSFYAQHIEPLPDARSVWRLKLYVWSLRPNVFKMELRNGFFRIFEDANPWPTSGCPEYERALKIAFSTLSPEDQRRYIDAIFERFQNAERPAYGYSILSSIFEHLTQEDKDRAAKIYDRPLNASYEPHTAIGPVMAGTVVPQTPSDAEEGFKKTVPEIVELLKTKWAPETLYENHHKHEDFLRPINGEGIGNTLQAKIKERLSDYVESALLFFDRENLDSNYTYSYLRGVYDAIRADRAASSKIDWSPFIKFAQSVAQSGTEKAFEHKGRGREQFDSWLSGWRDVHSALADVLHDLFIDFDEGAKPAIDFDKHRDALFEVIAYLLSFPSPEPADEQLETAMSKVKDPGDNEYQVNDPYSTAINTARGRAFEAFLQFVFQDGKKFAKGTKSRVSDDVKKVYEGLLRRENTRAIMFMFGHYLYFFYYRDIEWIKSLFPEIFSTDPKKSDLYLAAWEGYLTSALYPELLRELEAEYARAISLNASDYPKRRYRANLDEALATHLALAYLHLKDVTFTSPLYVSFWEKDDTKRHQFFASFIGRHVISRDQPENWLKENPEVKPKKMLAFWDWALEKVTDPKVFETFGFWINTKVKIFDPLELVKRVRVTLEKSKGKIDWEYGLMEALPIFADVSPEDTVEILRLYFTEMDTSVQARGFMHIDADLVEVFRKLFINPKTKETTRKLITDLLPIGNGVYWGLKAAMENPSA